MEIGSAANDLEYSDLPEKSLCRVIFGPSKIFACSGSLHRLEMLQHCLSNYDYPPYFSQAETTEHDTFAEHDSGTASGDGHVTSEELDFLQVWSLTHRLFYGFLTQNDWKS